MAKTSKRPSKGGKKGGNLKKIMSLSKSKSKSRSKKGLLEEATKDKRKCYNASGKRVPCKDPGGAGEGFGSGAWPVPPTPTPIDDTPQLGPGEGGDFAGNVPKPWYDLPIPTPSWDAEMRQQRAGWEGLAETGQFIGDIGDSLTGIPSFNQQQSNYDAAIQNIVGQDQPFVNPIWDDVFTPGAGTGSTTPVVSGSIIGKQNPFVDPAADAIKAILHPTPLAAKPPSLASFGMSKKQRKKWKKKMKKFKW